MTSLPWALLAWSLLGFPVPHSGVWGRRASPALQRLSWRPLKQTGHFQVHGTMWGLSVGANVTALSWWQERFLMAGKRQLHTCLCKGQEHGSGELSLQKGDGVSPLGLAVSHNWEQPAQIWAWPVSSPTTEALQPRAGWHAACTLILANLLPSWDRQVVTWVENGPNCQAHNCHQQYELQLVTRGVPQRSVAEPMVVYLCVPHVDENKPSGSCWCQRAGLLLRGTSADWSAGSPRWKLSPGRVSKPGPE